MTERNPDPITLTAEVTQLGMAETPTGTTKIDGRPNMKKVVIVKLEHVENENLLCQFVTDPLLAPRVGDLYDVTVTPKRLS